jgi:threonylcarbamoyladenosine tRNA methylthiotransferase MtaB
MKLCLKMTGCRNNRYELDRVLLWAAQNEVEIVQEQEASHCVINTCTVTHVADRKSRQMVRRTKHGNPALKMIVFGCGARGETASMKTVSESDVLLSTVDEVLDFLSEALTSEKRARASGKRMAGSADEPGGLRKKPRPTQRLRALVQVQDGCDTYCSYCIIAKARGPSKSRPADEIVEEVRARVAEGYREIVLTGINIGAYGCSLTTKPDESRFAGLLERILAETDASRLRISSLGPEFFNEKLFRVLAHPRVCPHIHLSVQSGSDAVLKRMNRRYTLADMDAVIHRLKADQPHIAITADLIVGFPEETDSEFSATAEFVRRHSPAKVHVFPFSSRRGTLAARMLQLPDPVKKSRAAALQSISDECRRNFIRSNAGRTASVLWERHLPHGFCEGLTDTYLRIVRKGDHPIGELTGEVTDGSET